METHKSIIAECQRIYYNFIKPLQALDGKTPSEKVGINLRENNKILKLIKEM